MAYKAIFRYQINLINSDLLGLGTVVRNPRVYKPQDLESACQNLEILPVGGQPPDAYIQRLVEFVLRDFFAMAHRTGLYNRQKVLWESLSKVTGIAVDQHQKGLFRKTPLPVFDLEFQDHKDRTLILARLVEPEYEADESYLTRLLKDLLERAKRTGGLVGLFFCSPAPLPDALRRKVGKLTRVEDPVAKYESLLPEPLGIPLDLLEIDTETSREPAQAHGAAGIRLVHPDLTATRRVRAATVDDPDPSPPS
jgi:hypothetical protein